MTSQRSEHPRRSGDLPGGTAPRRSPRVIGAYDGRARAELDLGGDWPGPADAGALLSLGHAVALAAGASALQAPGDAVSNRLPRMLELTVNLFRDDSRGRLTAEAELTHRGRSTLIVDVQVHDEQKRLVAALVMTQLAPSDADSVRKAS
jgi:acyl-coenzyme A thioesterase PaaI-like protein